MKYKHVYYLEQIRGDCVINSNISDSSNNISDSSNNISNGSNNIIDISDSSNNINDSSNNISDSSNNIGNIIDNGSDISDNSGNVIIKNNIDSIDNNNFIDDNTSYEVNFTNNNMNNCNFDYQKEKDKVNLDYLDNLQVDKDNYEQFSKLRLLNGLIWMNAIIM